MNRKAKFNEALAAAVRVLSEGSAIAGYKQIAYEAVSRGYWNTDHPNPELFLNQAICYDIKRNKRKSLFVRVKDGMALRSGAKLRSGLYALRHRFEHESIKLQEAGNHDLEEKIKHIETNIAELWSRLDKIKKIS
jgi:hypothetical protein